MNNIQLKVKLDSLNTEYVGQEAKIVVSGKAKFQFYDKGNTQTRLIAYRSYGQTALALKEAGANSVHAVSGSLNVYPPNEQNPSHFMLLTISNALPVLVTKTPVEQPQPTEQLQPVAQPSSAEQPQPVEPSQPVDDSQQVEQSKDSNDDSIPF
ncbi:hypothetical protein [Crocosphaera chwakensis]|uniref:Single-stranded DNA-binding protein n=1 Tax=Crocosphaera chwakensis CCY0110 TaxID=391612 RepID=A3IXD4_9CHRO|nr:hypothetical protein [Crocosphaera chwakensis]EAZ88877.1 hypothetical protein CY0110_31325 [Crocosphaera chwakensis CCY0110]